MPACSQNGCPQASAYSPRHANVTKKGRRSNLMHPEQAIAALRFDPLLPVWLIVTLGMLAA